jgi:ATP-dependent DNA helicase RecG
MKLTEMDIKSIIDSGEGYNAEFKIRIPTKLKELAAEICSFANAAGGIILLGVDDKNIIHGIDADNKKRSAIQEAINQINPHLYCSFYFVELEEKKIAVIEVPSGDKKPYTLSGAIYVRQGPNSQKITLVEQMRDFFQQSSRIYFDEGICNHFLFERDFDIDFFEEFRFLAGLSPNIGHLQIINNLKLINRNGNYKNGSVLFFGKKPEFFFEKAVIRCVAFEGTNKVHIIDDKVWGGPLLQQYRNALLWLKSRLSIRYIIEGSGPRKEVWEIPETAFKEAIINALSHRDYYDKGGRIMIELFSDRVEITNPGGLVSVIADEEFGKKSYSRNPLIFGLFERINMVEQIGSGINRINEAMKTAKLPKPIFKTKGLFTIVFSRPVGKTSGKMSGKTSGKIINLILENSFISIPEMASVIGVAERTIERNIQKLQKENKLKRIGGAKGGHWEVIE